MHTNDAKEKIPKGYIQVTNFETKMGRQTMNSPSTKGAY